MDITGSSEGLGRRAVWRGFLTLMIAIVVVGGARLSIGQSESVDTDAAGTPISETQPAETPADEAAIAELVDQMGDPSYAVREAAQQKLEALGPESVPALQQYRDHPDLEVRMRVRKAIESFGDIADGAIVLSVAPGSQAERAGMKVGDVIVRVNDTNITGHLDVRNVGGGARTYTIWRNGALLTRAMDEGRAGVVLGTWTLSRGGADHARGMAAVTDPQQWAEARRRLSAAATEGMTDQTALVLLAGLHSYAHDHEAAMKALSASRLDVVRTGFAGLRLETYGLPVEGLITAALLEDIDQASDEHRAAAECWVSFFQPNREAATQLAGAPIGDVRRNDLRELMVGRMELACYERRWADALAAGAILEQADASSGWSSITKPYAVAAIAGGADDMGVRQLLRTLRVFDLADRTNVYDGEGAFWLVYSATVAAGRDDLRQLLGFAFNSVDREQRAALIADRTFPVVYRWSTFPAVLELIAPSIERGDSPVVKERYFKLLSAAPDTSLERFEKAWTNLIGEEGLQWELGRCRLFALCRFGQWEQASQWLAKLKVDPYWRDIARRPIELMLANPEKLDNQWKMLTGIVEAAEGPRSQPDNWYLRTFDNRVFHIDDEQKVHEYPGLPTQPLYEETFARHLERSGDVMTLRENGSSILTAYVLDPATKRWVDGRDTDLKLDLADKLYNAMFYSQRHLKRHYPIEGLPRQKLQYRTIDRNWVFIYYEQDIGFMVKRVPPELIDLSAVIGEAAGKDGPARIYLPWTTDDFKQPYIIPEREQAPEIFLPTDCGLWHFNPDNGEVTRVPLGLPNENVQVRLMNWPKKAGKVYVGVAPQDGGQIVEIDVTSRQHRLTGGYCGLGPVDGFYHHRKYSFLRRQDFLIDAIYQQRLQREATEKMH